MLRPRVAMRKPAAEAMAVNVPFTPPICRRIGCTNRATHVPVLRFCELGSVAFGEFAGRVALDIKLCVRHAIVLEAEDLYTDEGWCEIVDHVKAMGYPEPDRASIDVVAKPLRMM